MQFANQPNFHISHCGQKHIAAAISINNCRRLKFLNDISLKNEQSGVSVFWEYIFPPL